MPYSVSKNSDGTYRVTGAGGTVHMKRGSKEDAEKQVRLLEGIDAGTISRRRVRHRHA
jgi:hypothetical protein